MLDTLAVVLAGGKGSRLEPLTRDRAKPAVPFGGAYRIIDFTLSNCLNSGMRKNARAHPVQGDEPGPAHQPRLAAGIFCRELGEFIDVVPPQQRIDEHWYQGTADAVYQNIYTIEKERPSYVVILAGDHIYKMNYGKLVEYHKREQRRRDGRRLAGRAPGGPAVRRDGGRRRRIGSSASRRSRSSPKTIPGDERHCLASMGIYVFTARFLFEQLCLDATGPAAHTTSAATSSRRSSIRTACSPFRSATRTARGTRTGATSGTLDAYYDANMDLVSVDPQLNMYDAGWPIRTYQPNLPAAEVRVCRGAAAASGAACALDSIVCQGCVVSGGRVERRSSGRLAASTATPRSRTRSSSKAWTSAATPRSAGRSSTRASAFRRASRSATTSRKIANGVSRSAKAGSW